MKKYAYLIAAAVAMLACTKENNPATEPKPVEPQPLVEMTFGASLEESVSPSSRAAISGNKTVWTSSDKISVFDGAKNREFSSTGEGATVNFRGEAAAAEKYYALYPYQEGASCTEDGVIKATVPSVQTATLGSFDPAAALMVAQGSERFDFKNVCSLIKVTVPDGVTGITSIEFSGNADEYIAGEVNISFNESGLSIVSGAASNTIVLKDAEDKPLEAGDYYIAALPNTYSQGLKLLIHYENGMFQQAKATGNLTVARSAVRPVGSVKWPEVVFLGPDNDPGKDIEVNTAVQWMIYNIKNSAYIPFAAVTETALSNCGVVWMHYNKNLDGVADDSIDENFRNKISLLKNKLESGTGFLLTRFATNFQSLLGLSTKRPNNNYVGDILTDRVESIYTVYPYAIVPNQGEAQGEITHPVFDELTRTDQNNYWQISLLDSGYRHTHSTAKFNVHEYWSEYYQDNDNSYSKIKKDVGCEPVAKDGDQDIVIWEFPDTEDRKGKVLCIGTPLYDWHTTEGQWEWKGGSFHNNVLDMTSNAINYLKPASETASAE